MIDFNGGRIQNRRLLEVKSNNPYPNNQHKQKSQKSHTHLQALQEQNQKQMVITLYQRVLVMEYPNSLGTCWFQSNNPSSCRTKNKIANRNLSKANVLLLINDTWEAKQNYDATHAGESNLTVRTISQIRLTNSSLIFSTCTWKSDLEAKMLFANGATTWLKPVYTTKSPV